MQLLTGAGKQFHLEPRRLWGWYANFATSQQTWSVCSCVLLSWVAFTYPTKLFAVFPPRKAPEQRYLGFVWFGNVGAGFLSLLDIGQFCGACHECQSDASGGEVHLLYGLLQLLGSPGVCSTVVPHAYSTWGDNPFSHGCWSQDWQKVRDERCVRRERTQSKPPKSVAELAQPGSILAHVHGHGCDGAAWLGAVCKRSAEAPCSCFSPSRLNSGELSLALLLGSADWLEISFLPIGPLDVDSGCLGSQMFLWSLWAVRCSSALYETTWKPQPHMRAPLLLITASQW